MTHHEFANYEMCKVTRKKKNQIVGVVVVVGVVGVMAVVAVVVVVVLTVCLDHMSVHATKRPASDSGGPCPCGHDPLALHLCTGPLKNSPISSSPRR